MRLTKRELLASTAALVYIVFFALRPPAVVQSLLSSPVGLGLTFAAVLYLTFYKSKTVGGLLLLGLLLTMTKVTEHLDNPEQKEEPPATPANAPPTTPPATPPTTPPTTPEPTSTTTTAASTTTPPPTVTAAPPPVAPSGQTAAGEAPRPESTRPPASMPPTTAPPPLAAVPPRPVMACNIESFAPY